MDEQNRLQGVMDEQSLAVYQYDANGDRTYKLTGKHTHQNISGTWHHFYQLDNATLYASPYLVVTPKGYTKHYYAESERVASKLGNGGLLELDYPLVDESLFRVKRYANTEHAQDVVDKCLHAEDARPSAPLSYLYELMEVSQEPENERYWYHPDHLGSSSWITFSDGEAVQHLHYLPFGEDLVNQQLTVTGALFTFSAKEKDQETGFSYFGSRYYSSDLSIWLSVDPMASKYPSLSPYVYCANNPIKLVDPNGEEIVGTDGKAVSYNYDDKGNVVWSTNASDDTKRIGNAMLQTEAGKEQLDFLISGTKTKITMKISADNRGSVMGEMIPGKSTKNKDGSIELMSATIMIYEGSIINYLDKDNTKNDNMISDCTNMGMLVRETNPTIDQFIGAEACHEAEHVRPDNLMLNFNGAKQEEVEKSPNQKKANYLYQLWQSKKKE